MSESPVDRFCRSVQQLNESEYGDFKRKIGNYINRLEEEMGPGASPAVRQVLGQVRSELVYNPKPNIEAARSFLLKAGDKIRGLM